MKKELLVFTSLLIFSQIVSSQQLIKEKCHQEKKNTKCIPSLRIYKFSKDSFMIKTYNAEGIQTMLAITTNPDPDHLNGYTRFYSEEGIIESEGNYKDNVIAGQWKIYEKGKLERTIDYAVIDSVMLRESSETDSSTAFQQVDVMPEFKTDSIFNFRQYVARELFYPPQAVSQSWEGVVYIQFRVDKNGCIVQPEVVRGVCPDLDQEALRVVCSSPPWISARTNDNPVAVQFVMPIRFKLN